jgi:1-deoxy-D-xylulose-5-phosphate reductoisomerase
MKGVTILGATGTIGINTLDVIARHRDKFHVVALTAHSQVDRMAAHCLEHKPRFAVMVEATAAERLRQILKTSCPEVEVLSGEQGLLDVVTHTQTDYVMAAIVGAAGLTPTLAAARAGKRILLANKEALVMSGRVFMNAVRQSGAELLPIDSEHNAIFQCLPVNYATHDPSLGFKRIVLTGSGGPFRTLALDKLASVTPEQAIAHPNWNMGKKISVDSATMMNKGLEIIEACWLFDVTPASIEVVIHPQSIIHSMVEYIDGSILAQLGQPDMRTPIAYALAWPQRMTSGVAELNLCDVAKLEFSKPDLTRYPCLRLAQESAQVGGTTPTILNAANEVAVQAFLDRRISFTTIFKTVEYVLAKITTTVADNLAVILQADQQARWQANEYILGCSKKVGAS